MPANQQFQPSPFIRSSFTVNCTVWCAGAEGQCRVMAFADQHKNWPIKQNSQVAGHELLAHTCCPVWADIWETGAIMEWPSSKLACNSFSRHGTGSWRLRAKLAQQCWWGLAGPRDCCGATALQALHQCCRIISSYCERGQAWVEQKNPKSLKLLCPQRICVSFKSAILGQKSSARPTLTARGQHPAHLPCTRLGLGWL